MAYTINKNEDCRVKITFTYDNLDLAKEIKDALVSMQKKSDIKGFRKGKAPLSMIENLYRDKIEWDAIQRFIAKEYYETIKHEKLNVVGQPQIGEVDYKKNGVIRFDAVVEIFPEFELKEISGLKFSKDTVTVSAEEIEEVKKGLLKSKSELVEVTDPSVGLEVGHHAVMNFKGTRADGTSPESMSGKEHVLEIGSKQFIPGFEDGMLGMKRGESRDISLTFPNDYHQDDLKGEKVVFNVELLEIKNLKGPEFNDDLVKEYKFESVEDFYSKMKESIFARKEKEANDKFQNEVIQKLVEENPFSVPNGLVQMQVAALKEDMIQNLKKQGLGEKFHNSYFEKWGKEIEDRALFQIRSGLIINKYAEINKIEATEEDFNSKLEEVAKTNPEEMEKLKKYYQTNADSKSKLMFGIREEKTLKIILDSVAS